MSRERLRPELWPSSGLPVRELIAYDTGEIILVDGDYDGEYFAQFDWRTLGGYVTTWQAPIKSAYLARLAAAPLQPGEWVTYRNQNHLDCRSANLEVVTARQVAARRPIGLGRKGNSVIGHGFVGIAPHQWPLFKNGEPVGLSPLLWKARIAKKDVGYYATPEEAARAYDQAAVEKYGNDAQLNFPREHPLD